MAAGVLTERAGWEHPLLLTASLESPRTLLGGGGGMFPWGNGSQGDSVMLPHTRCGQPEFSAVLIITNSLWEANSK